MPLVSIIVAAHNASEYIDKMIESVQNQVYTNWELIIIDDGSTDNTKQKVLLKNEARIRYFRQERKGVSAARNYGFREMKGAYFCILDADDELSPLSLDARVKRIIETKSDIALGGVGRKYVDGSYHIYHPVLISKSSKASKKTNLIDEVASLSDKVFIHLGELLVKRSANTNYAIMDEHMSHSEDVKYFLQMLNKTTKACIVPKVVYYYLNRPHSAITKLEKVEEGYRAYYAYVLSRKDVKRWSKFICFYRFHKVMFLSYLSERKIQTSRLDCI